MLENYRFLDTKPPMKEQINQYIKIILCKVQIKEHYGPLYFVVYVEQHCNKAQIFLDIWDFYRPEFLPFFCEQKYYSATVDP